MTKKMKSRYRGVSWNKGINKWCSKIKFDKDIHLGYYNDEVEAAKRFDVEARKLRGMKARVNFPQNVWELQVLQRTSSGGRNRSPTFREAQPTDEPCDPCEVEPAAKRARASSKCKSEFYGVYWCKQNQKWKAFSTQKKHLGFYDSPVQAAVAYDEAERELQKENCGNSKVKLNFPDLAMYLSPSGHGSIYCVANAADIENPWQATVKENGMLKIVGNFKNKRSARIALNKRLVMIREIQARFAMRHLQMESLCADSLVAALQHAAYE